MIARLKAAQRAASRYALISFLSAFVGSIAVGMGIDAEVAVIWCPVLLITLLLAFVAGLEVWNVVQINALLRERDE